MKKKEISLDKIANLNGALIHHGPFNNRIYVMKVPDNLPDYLDQLIGHLKNLSEEKGYTKIFCKVREEHIESFRKNGFIVEAEVPGLFNGMDTGYFLSYYMDSHRSIEVNRRNNEEILQLSLDRKPASNRRIYKSVPEGFKIRRCLESDVSIMANLYKAVFQTYPFPIHNPDYLLETMNSNVSYFCVSKDGAIVALASSEKDLEGGNSEMTDFATLPDFRGYGFASLLLMEMEKDLREQNFKTAFTIARSASPGMNITFSKCGYSYAGRLINNTNISGNMESMNIWYKHLVSPVSS